VQYTQLFITFVITNVMVIRLRNIFLVVAGVFFFASCDDSRPAGSGAIVLGDSSVIVTESDPQQLKDLVTDLQPVIPPAENKDEDPGAAENKPDSSRKPLPAQSATTLTPSVAKPQPQPVSKIVSSGPGLKAEFKDVTIIIPGLTVKQAGNPNLNLANGAVYTLNDGNVNGATMRIIGTVTKVSQRYQSVVVLKKDNGMYPLDALSLTTKWEPVTGSNNTYRITGLDAKSMKVYDADAGDIKSAVQRMTQRRRMSRKMAQEIQNSTRNLRAVNQKPLNVELRSVMWKIDGKDANGRLFSKQIRIDVPM
jgi:hypothetical protein